MQITTKIVRVGNSLGVLLPKKLLEKEGLVKGDWLEVLYRVPPQVNIIKGKVKK